VLALGVACSEGPPLERSFPPLPADRGEYEAFAATRSDLPAESYLPFAVHRVRRTGSGVDVLVVCRWELDRFPLPVAVEAPDLEADLREGADPRAADVYLEAVERALQRWEEEVGPPLEFRPPAEGEPPAFTIRLLGERAPTPDPEKAVLGSTRLGRSCRLLSPDLVGEALPVEFVGPPEMRIYVADRFGLLTPEQVETVAAHELGHALGIRGHSPFESDLMHEVARDRLGDRRLSDRDVATARALYRLPNGLVYARRDEGEPPGPRVPQAPGPPRLGTPRVEPALGVAVRWPEGWRRLDIPHGAAAVAGLPWDYDASLQLVLLEGTDLDGYLGRYADAHFGHGPMLEQGELRVGAWPGLRFVQAIPERASVEELVLLELGPGRLLRLIAEAPRPLYGAYADWFEAVLASLRPAAEGADGDQV